MHLSDVDVIALILLPLPVRNAVQRIDCIQHQPEYYKFVIAVSN